VLSSECQNYNPVFSFLLKLSIFQLNNESGVYLHVATLIEPIDSKLCLWDKTGDSYRDTIEQSKAWREICAFLDGDFHQMDGKKQHAISKCTFINAF